MVMMWVYAVTAAISVGKVQAFRFDGIGGLSGGGATSTFLEAYDPAARDQILDWLFKPGYAVSLGILKVEIGADDQTTDGCEGCHMRSPTDLNCSRGYEWALMKQAVQRNPEILLYGLPWGFAGWLGFGTSNPYHNVTATADYTAKWVECGRDVHGLNISMLGLWNEAWVANGRPSTDAWEYALALRARLDSSGLGHVRIIVPDGDIADMVAPLQSNATYRGATWGLGQHYPGAGGTTPAERALGMPMWSSEDYSTYSDATGGGCWGRLLVQNVGWGYSATISWYLLGAFARGMDYDSDGFLRAEWPTSGHWEVTPMAWITMHWTLFTEVGWDIQPCNTTGRCTLPNGGNFALLTSATDATLIVETFRHNTSKCIRKDPPDWEVQQRQEVTFSLPDLVHPGSNMNVWRSCTGWRYPADDDDWLVHLESVVVSPDYTVTLVADADCYYTITTLTDREKPVLPKSQTATSSTAFPLPYQEDFEGRTVGGEAPYFGDQEGKWETAIAGAGRVGSASQQQVLAWPILEPQCNDHSQPITIIGDLFFESVRITADVLVQTNGTGVGVALRVRNPGSYFRGVAPGLFLYVGATPNVDGTNSGGSSPQANVPLSGWALCADSFCQQQIVTGALPSRSLPPYHNWLTLGLEVTNGMVSGAVNKEAIFAKVPVSQEPQPPSGAECIHNTTIVTDKVIAGFDYHQIVFNMSVSESITECVTACCADTKCKAWSITANSIDDPPLSGSNTCWLKTGGAMEKRPGQLACGLKPTSSDAGSAVPPSGWAAVVATLGSSQFDNFHLEGTAGGGLAVRACDQTPPSGGENAVSAPCDYPGAVTSFTTTATGGPLRLSDTNLCLGSLDMANVTLVPCDSSSVLTFDVRTGRVLLATMCMTAMQRERHDMSLSLLELTPCAPLPSDSQQFQFQPQTGALRQKGSECIAEVPGTTLNYRDCCVALCA